MKKLAFAVVAIVVGALVAGLLRVHLGPSAIFIGVVVGGLAGWGATRLLSS